MLRKQLSERGIGVRHGFRMRGGEIARIESFSDAVFAFAVTLLVVSLEVPTTFSELLETIKGFPAFAFGFALLFWIWYNQYSFFRMYGLEDGGTIALTGMLLFVVVFFVYPLKFLFAYLVKAFSGQEVQTLLPNGTLEHMILPGQIVPLMVIYGLGYIAIFGVLALMFRHALRKREELELSELEEFDTRYAIRGHVLNALIGALSVGIVLIFGERNAMWSGFVYMLVGPVMALHGSRWGKRRRAFASARSSQS
jgi:hypothetical protein